MKILRYFLYIIATLVAIYLILCLVGPKDLNVEKSAKIDASESILFNMVNDLKEWEAWSPWINKDTSMKVTFGQKTAGKGATYAWLSNEMGNGNLEILESSKNKSIKTKLIFDDFGDASYGHWSFEKVKNLTKVTWGMEGGDLSFLMRGMMLAMNFKGKMKSDFKEGLMNMKNLAESRAKNTYNGFKINNIEFEEKHFLSRRAVIDAKNVQQHYTRNLGGLYSKIQENKIELDGMPCGLIYNQYMPNDQVDIAAAMPVKKKTTLEDAIYVNIEKQNAYSIDYYGPYENLNTAHNALNAYFRDRGLFVQTPMIEQYETDPGEEKDPTKWLTKIIYYASK